MPSTAPATLHQPPSAFSPAASHAALHALLDRGLQAHAPEYDHGLSNHLPMLLHALQQLGATPARLADHAADYAVRLARRDKPAAARPHTLADWAARRGDMAAFEPLQAHFATVLARQGRAATLREALPRLMPGVGAGAFHGLIRTAHALEAGHDGELAAGLAYWAAAWLPLREPAAPWPAMDHALPEWLAALQGVTIDGALPQPRIVLRLQAVAATPGFDAVAGALRVDRTTLRALAEHAAALYAVTGNFTVLHAVTACRALAVLMPQLADPTARTQALREFALALGAALHAARLTRFAPADHPPPPAPWGWPALRAAAIAARDDHTAKLVHACWQLGQRWPAAAGGIAEVWAQAATRAVLAAGAPPLAGVDHLHVFVADRTAATAWYARVLGLRPVAALAHWAHGDGPLVLADADGRVNLALFERPPQPNRATLALTLDAQQWPAWRAHLAAQPALPVELADHGEAWSLYFTDPDGNPYELTCHDVAALKATAQP